MDSETARKLQGRLQQELDAIRSPSVSLPYARMLIDMEISRLVQRIDKELKRSKVDGFEFIPVDNQFMLSHLARLFGVKDLPSYRVFKRRLIAELDEGIKNFHQPLPLTSQFMQRVIEHLEDEISRQEKVVAIQRAAEAKLPLPSTTPWQEFVGVCIKDAVDEVLEKNPQGASSDQVLHILSQNPSIHIDNKVKSVVRQVLKTCHSFLHFFFVTFLVFIFQIAKSVLLETYFFTATMAMDTDSARKLKGRLQQELDAFSSSSIRLPYARMLMDMEISRLAKGIDSELKKPALDGFVFKIPVDNQFMLSRLANLFGVKDLSSYRVLKGQLIAELNEGIKNFDQPLPLTSQFMQRVIEHLEEEISMREKLEAIHSARGAKLPLISITPWQDFVDVCIKDAIDEVFEKNPQGASSDQVLHILEQNPSIHIDNKVKSVVRQKFFEATFPLDRKSAPGDREVARLYKDIHSKSTRFIEDGDDIKIAVDNQLMMFNLSNEYGLGDISSLEDFKGKLNAELERIR
ncbi:hypothetical protein QQ045_023338 [Rhodiola kirilowii]